jgi:hypothetical protein
VERAIAVAFPDGYPRTEPDLERAKEWSDEQLEAMEALFEQFENRNGYITNRLAAYARRHGVAWRKVRGLRAQPPGDVASAAKAWRMPGRPSSMCLFALGAKRLR